MTCIQGADVTGAYFSEARALAMQRMSRPG
jgi:hypothetical protein